MQKLQEGGTWTVHVEGEGELEAIDFEFGKGEGGEFQLRRTEEKVRFEP